MLTYYAQRTTQCSYFLVCWAIPGPPFMTTVMAFERRLPVGEDPTFDKLFDEFRSGTDDQRRSRFKYIPSLKVAPWMVSTLVDCVDGLHHTAVIAMHYLHVDSLHAHWWRRTASDYRLCRLAKPRS